MRTFLCLVALVLAFSQTNAQNLTITNTCTMDTAGVPADVIPSLEHQVDIVFQNSALGGYTKFRAGIGVSQNDESLFQREFDLSDTGTFDDGCTLTVNGGEVSVGLGTYTGLEDFYVTVTPLSPGGGEGTPFHGSFTY